jgi:integrase
MARRTFGNIRKLPSGRFQASYIGNDGHRHNAPRTFHTKTDANQWLTMEEASLIKGTWESPRAAQQRSTIPTLFRDYAERHINIQTTHHGDSLRESTKALYRRLLRHNLKAFLDVPLSAISVSDVSDWWAESVSSGKKTITSKAYKLLSAIMTRAVAEGLRIGNPCIVKGAQSATTGKSIVVPNHEEVTAIAAHINPRYTKLVLLCAFAGLRFGEITALRRGDIIPEIRAGKKAYRININKAVTLVDGVHRVDLPKSRASIRIIPVSSSLTPMIDDLLGENTGASSEALLFPSASGGYIRHDVFTNSWKPALKRAGIVKNVTPHSLRHFAGTNLAIQGGNLAELKGWLGDSTTSAVMRYIHDTGRADQLVEGM